jgi:hypothetical protein
MGQLPYTTVLNLENEVENVKCTYTKVTHGENNYMFALTVTVFERFLSYSGAECIESTPSFTSGWKNMTANSGTSEEVIPHGLKEFPFLVTVEAKTEDGWVFSGFGSAQSDDDGAYVYGGVVFMHNKISVRILIPKSLRPDRWMTNYTAVYLGSY